MRRRMPSTARASDIASRPVSASRSSSRSPSAPALSSSTTSATPPTSMGPMVRTGTDKNSEGSANRTADARERLPLRLRHQGPVGSSAARSRRDARSGDWSGARKLVSELLADVPDLVGGEGTLLGDELAERDRVGSGDATDSPRPVREEPGPAGADEAQHGLHRYIAVDADPVGALPFALHPRPELPPLASPPLPATGIGKAAWR